MEQVTRLFCCLVLASAGIWLAWLAGFAAIIAGMSPTHGSEGHAKYTLQCETWWNSSINPRLFGRQPAAVFYDPRHRLPQPPEHHSQKSREPCGLSSQTLRCFATRLDSPPSRLIAFDHRSSPLNMDKRPESGLDAFHVVDLWQTDRLERPQPVRTLCSLFCLPPCATGSGHIVPFGGYGYLRRSSHLCRLLSSSLVLAQYAQHLR
ncbi:hypothetical protein B0H67DRAFT_549701 [Lasiosphaeris hirsuta]|uniref:Uncharacterized protein n=1 Tax=Lasiosphaeris hirsuta TaxID=260670 RepID=A0AA40BD45_9PEZI|nr:hypothetical protein B0H67DRAFT_549701 [Lasiosphaeris hirsuta]